MISELYNMIEPKYDYQIMTNDGRKLCLVCEKRHPDDSCELPVTRDEYRKVGAILNLKVTFGTKCSLNLERFRRVKERSLSLIPEQEESKTGEITLDDCIEAFQKEEIMDGIN